MVRRRDPVGPIRREISKSKWLPRRIFGLRDMGFSLEGLDFSFAPDFVTLDRVNSGPLCSDT